MSVKEEQSSDPVAQGASNPAAGHAQASAIENDASGAAAQDDAQALSDAQALTGDASDREPAAELSPALTPGDVTPLADAWDAHGGDVAENFPERTTMPAADIGRAHLKGLIEALVFVADRPVTLNDIAKSAGKADRKVVRSLVDELRLEYRDRGIHLEEVAGGLMFRTNPAYGPFIRDAAAKKPVKMSRAQLEALAIIAYRQPLTRPEVDEIRGVDSGPVMKMLLDRDLIRILGKKDEPGRPLLYGTTPVFLEFFGLKSLKDLPSLREFTELSDDSRKVFDREMTDLEADANAATLAMAASSVGDGASGGPSTRAEDFEDPATDPRVEGGPSSGDLER